MGQRSRPLSVVRPGRRVEHRSACAHVVLVAYAVVLFHADGLDRDMRDVLHWCDWLLVPNRVIRLDPELL